jgi:hypothetical protein
VKELRSFGLIVGGIFSVIGLWPLLLRGESVRPWALICAALLLLPAVVYPRVLKPVRRVWMAIGHVLGWINTRIILGIVFYGLVAPMGVIMRAFGKDPMRRRLEPEAETYRLARQSRQGTHMKHQF